MARRKPTDCLGLFRTSQGPRTLDIAVVGKQGRGAEHRRSRQRQHNWAHFQKNILKPHLKQQWVIPPKANSAFVAAMERRAGRIHAAARSRYSSGLPG